MKCFSFSAVLLGSLLSIPVSAQQQADPKSPVVVQPGAPGQPTRTLPPSTRATLPPYSPADVQFMQHMIVHHAQAVEMTALIESHSENKDLRSLGERVMDHLKIVRGDVTTALVATRLQRAVDSRTKPTD